MGWEHGDDKKASSKKRPPMKIKLKKGALHKELGIPQGQKIPLAAEEREKAKGGRAAKRAQFAINARGWKHGR